VQDERDERVIIIPVGREGVRILDDWDGMGQRMTASGSLVLEDVQVFAHEVSQRGYTTLAGRHGSALRQLHLVATAAGIVRNIVADDVSPGTSNYSASRRDTSVSASARPLPSSRLTASMSR
jgi:alkylation response protein AidB-like acyl-CoA dehydrogenase